MAAPSSTLESGVSLGTPITDEAIRSVNFFNGRLLTGKDLSREQEARRLADRRVGAASGPGIAWGLEVNALDADPQGRVKVLRGLGVSPSGHVLALATDPTVTLVALPAETVSGGDAGFGPCGALSGAPYVAGDGLFLLTLAPATPPEGKAPVLALDAINTRCSTDAYVEAVQLRLLRINGWSVSGSDAGAVARLRNQIAYACFAPQGQASAHRQPGTAAAGGLLEQMRSEGLSECDVPLAVVYMVDERIVFLDRWAVRRRLAAGAASDAWAAWLGERVCALGEAQLAQFQDHIADTPALLAGAATASLAWLPPAGFLPAGTNWQAFLGARAPAREVPLASSDAPDVLAGALRADAVDLTGAAAAGTFRVYRIGAGGPLLFVRDGRNVHHAEQIWLDGTRAGLPGVTEVQTAIDRLRAGTCLHVALRPGMNIAAALEGLKKKQDVTICFEPGGYKLGTALQLSNLGRVRVQGHGALLVNMLGECALRILDCDSAEVSDIAVEGAVAGTGKDALGIGLEGALTVVDTPLVTIERVEAICAAGKPQGAAAIVVTVRDKMREALAPARFTVADCALSVGNGQQGVLCVNGAVVRIRGNHIAAAKAESSLQRGIVVAGQFAGSVQIDDNVVRDVVRGIAVGISESAEVGDEPLKAERVAMERNRVELHLGDVTSGGRYGIFVGNAGSVLARGNHVLAAEKDGMRLQLHAMRLAGEYGAQVVVRDNLFEGAFRGIVFQPQEPKEQLEYFVWAFQFNVALGKGSMVLVVPRELAERIIDDHNEQGTELAPSSAPK